MKAFTYALLFLFPIVSAGAEIIDRRVVQNGYVAIVDAAVPYGWIRTANPSNGTYGFMVPNTQCAVVFGPVTTSNQQFGLREASLNALRGFAQTYPILRHSEPAFVNNAGGTSSYGTDMVVQTPQGNVHVLAVIADGAHGGRVIATYSCDNPTVDVSAYNQAGQMMASVVVTVVAVNAPPGAPPGDISNNSGATGAIGVFRHGMDIQNNGSAILHTFNTTH
jgi:hypothetical protein